MRSLLFLLSIFLLASQACAQHEYLVIGKGGGISGEVLQFRISHKGKVYKGTGIADIQYAMTAKIKKSEARKIFVEFGSIQDSSFHHPGNLYYFIHKVGEGCKTEYTWGEQGFEVPENLTILYKNSMSRLSGLSYKPVKKPIE